MAAGSPGVSAGHPNVIGVQATLKWYQENPEELMKLKAYHESKWR